MQEPATCNLDQDYMKISKSEYEAFKDRLYSIETKISHEFNLTKLDAVKAEMGQDDSMLLNGPERVQNKYHQTLQEVEKLEDSERKTEQLARRLSRDLKIRPSADHAIMRSPSARKIGSLRRRRDSATRLSRTQSWHLGQSSPGPIVKQAEDATHKFVHSTSFYPKSNLKRAKPVQQTAQIAPRPLPAIPSSAEKPEKVIPEKPLRVKRESSDHFVTPHKVTSKQQESWTSATDFFSNPEVEMKADTPQKQQLDDDMFFKTPVRPKRLSAARSTTKNENDFTKTPMLPPRLTPARRFTPMSAATTPMDFSAINKTLMLTPSLHDSSQGRESIIILRNKNAGMVAQKAKLFNGMSEDQPVKIPRVVINKNLENVKSMSFDKTPNKNRHNVPLPSPRSPRRSSRSPAGVNKRNQFKASTQSPLLKTIRECSERQKANLLKPEILNEIASPKRKPLSQNNTPRRTSKTPTKKRRQTPSKSPRFVRRFQSTENSG
jgi:hypothetical protein